MKYKIIIAILTLLLTVSLLANYVLYGVLNDEINAERAIIRCIFELEGMDKSTTSIDFVESHVKKCILDNTTLR